MQRTGKLEGLIRYTRSSHSVNIDFVIIFVRFETDVGDELEALGVVENVLSEFQVAVSAYHRSGEGICAIPKALVAHNGI
jgi:hypothetical protein